MVVEAGSYEAEAESNRTAKATLEIDQSMGAFMMRDII